MPAAPTLRKGAVLAIVLASYTMIVLDISIVITALPKIHRTLGFSATALSWVQNAYLLTFGGLLLLGALAGDLFGRRRVFIIGLGLFTVASAAVRTAQRPRSGSSRPSGCRASTASARSRPGSRSCP